MNIPDIYPNQLRNSSLFHCTIPPNLPKLYYKVPEMGFLKSTILHVGHMRILPSIRQYIIICC